MSASLMAYRTPPATGQVHAPDERGRVQERALIPLQEQQLAGQVVDAVDGLELHDFLEVRRDYATWIRDRIQKYGFAEGVDYNRSPVLGSGSRGGGHNRMDYFLSLDMAKELAMVERTAKGREARQYFIECERRLKASATALPSDLATALNDPRLLRQMLLSKAERVIELEDAIVDQAPKVAAFERIANADGAISITKAAKTLQMAPSDLFGWMALHGWLYRGGRSGSWLAFQPRLERGQLTHKVMPIERRDGTEILAEQVLVTPKGLARLAELIEAAKGASVLAPALRSNHLTR